VAFSDVVGKTIPRGKRGQLLAMRASLGGALTLVAGLALRFTGGERTGIGLYLILIAAAAVLWAVAALLFAAIAEAPGATTGGRNALATIAEAAGLLTRASGLRRHLLARGMLLPVELAVPFYALHSRQLGLDAGDLGIAIIAVGIANLVSSPLWGRIADQISSRLVMILAAATSVAASALALLIDHLAPTSLTALWYAPVFFLAGLAIAGVRLGRKTYLVDATDQHSRPVHVSLANTIMGGLTFAFGVLGVVAQVAGTQTLLGLLLVVAAAGALASWWMPTSEDMARA
jgi:Na+/melibiose symporter-like transporter